VGTFDRSKRSLMRVTTWHGYLAHVDAAARGMVNHSTMLSIGSEEHVVNSFSLVGNIHGGTPVPRDLLYDNREYTSGARDGV